jgi:hypothetical protein
LEKVEIILPKEVCCRYITVKFIDSYNEKGEDDPNVDIKRIEVKGKIIEI